MILTVAGQRAVELKAVARGLSLARLMETAGARAFSYITDHFDLAGAPVAVLCGSGGNGGDGFVAARLLKEAGADPVILLCAGTPRAAAPAAMYRRALSAGVPALDIEMDREAEARLKSCAVAVDAVFGIGFRGEIPPPVRALFHALNTSDTKVVSMDIPSGVNADTGRAAEEAVRADATVCFVAKKTAHLLKSAGGYCGEIVVEDLGIPESCFSAAGRDLSEIGLAAAAEILHPKEAVGHKGSFGRLLLIAGSDRYRGAAVLAAMGAVYAGAGLVTVASAEKVLFAVAAQLPEVILLDRAAPDEEIAAELAKSDVCAIGSGMTVTEETRALFRTVTGRAGCPLVIDADGLTILAEDLDLLKQMRGDVILTPHFGEFSRLSGYSVEEIANDRVGKARAFAKEHRVVLILKSENTAVALPNGRVFLNASGNSGLAKAGSGDLLSGVVAALSARGHSAAEAAVAGVFLHSRAADIAETAVDRYAMTPSLAARFLSDAYRDVWRAKADGAKERGKPSVLEAEDEE